MSAPEKNAELEDLLDYLVRTRGFDFTAYKQPGLMRRIQKRLDALQINSYAAYRDYLEVHPEEFARLFDAVLINVTGFFRDPLAWETLQNEVIPRLLQGKRADEAIRVWSAGCASGEEAYTLAMILAEVLGLEGFRSRGENLCHRHR